MVKRVGSVLLMVLALGTAACSSSSQPAPEATTGATTAPATTSAGDCDPDSTVCITEKDFVITASQDTWNAGTVPFSIFNAGPSQHEFVVIKTDLPADQLPVDEASGTIEESAEGMKVIDEAEDIAAGAEAQISPDLQPGAYVLICNLPEHYRSGMHLGFTVGEPSD